VDQGGVAEFDAMTLARPSFRPDSSLSREEMLALQREIAAAAAFDDDHDLTPVSVAVNEATALTNGLPESEPDAGDADDPVVVGVDQAFCTDRDGGPDAAVSAAVAMRGGRVIEYASAVTPLSIPYVPGLLSFREGTPILAALESLAVSPDLLVCDGSGRIHYRQAGLATHVGVTVGCPAIGVAKGLLCGTPEEPVDERPAGWRTPIRADDSVEPVSEADVDRAEPPVIGYAYQSRQYPTSRRVNPLYVSPGHRVSAATAVDLVAALCAGYKLPEPTRLADAHADRVKRQHDNR
jgi:deoxyribonuclease V